MFYIHALEGESFNIQAVKWQKSDVYITHLRKKVGKFKDTNLT